MKRKSASALCALAICTLIWPSMAGAITFVQTFDDCSAPCGITAKDQIDVTAEVQGRSGVLRTSSQTASSLPASSASPMTLQYYAMAAVPPVCARTARGGIQLTVPFDAKLK